MKKKQRDTETEKTKGEEEEGVKKRTEASAPRGLPRVSLARVPPWMASARRRRNSSRGAVGIGRVQFALAGNTMPLDAVPVEGIERVTLEQVQAVNAKAADVYRYMNFDQIAEFKELADTVTV